MSEKYTEGEMAYLEALCTDRVEVGTDVDDTDVSSRDVRGGECRQEAVGLPTKIQAFGDSEKPIIGAARDE